jgi:hypothetical protein
MEPDGLLLHSTMSATYPCPEPAHTDDTLLLKNVFSDNGVFVCARWECALSGRHI